MIRTIVTRRGFLRTLLLAGSLVFMRRAEAFDTIADPHPDHLLSTKLVDLFHNKNSARAIGLEYLRIAPALERHPRELTRLICSHWQEREKQIDHADIGRLKQILMDQQREDFANGRIVNVQGWILSETEARLCALAALV